jgi:Golgi apparatus protein 1
MTIICPAWSRTAAVAAAMLAFGVNTHAQDTISARIEARLAAASEKIKNGCNLDLQKFCGSVTPGEGRLMLCIMAHEDKLNAKCDYTLYQASRNLEHALDRIVEVADACSNEIEAKCAALPPGQGQIAQCLVANKASLTPACRKAVNSFPSSN